MDPPSPTLLPLQGGNISPSPGHISKFLDRRQGKVLTKGNRSHWEVKWGHKERVLAGEGVGWAILPGLMDQCRVNHQGCMRGPWGEGAVHNQ